MTAQRLYTMEEARRFLVERIRADRTFAARLIADPATALAGADPAALFGLPSDDDEVQGYAMNATITNLGNPSYCNC